MRGALAWPLTCPSRAVDELGMQASHLALVAGWQNTRSALVAYNERPGPVLRSWVLASAAVGVLLLVAVWLIASLSTASAAPRVMPADANAVGGMADVAQVLVRNSLVLALHAMACVAGFIARSSFPPRAEHERGAWRELHDRAGPLAIACVVGATVFSLSAQAYVLGTQAAAVADRLALSPGVLLLALTPHALPELTALFLPLAAWIAASRRGDWEQLLAATFVTVAVALPVLAIAALTEVYFTPHLVAALT